MWDDDEDEDFQDDDDRDNSYEADMKVGTIKDLSLETVKEYCETYFASLRYDDLHYLLFLEPNIVLQFPYQACFRGLMDAGEEHDLTANNIKYLAVDPLSDLRARGFERHSPAYGTRAEVWNEAVVLRYIDFIINHSQFADAHVIKNPKHVLEHGCLISAEFPTQYCITAAIAIRYVNEFPNHVETAIKLMDMGVDEKFILPLIHVIDYTRCHDQRDNNYKWLWRDHFSFYAHEIAGYEDTTKEYFTALADNDQSRFKVFPNLSESVDFRDWMHVWYDNEDEEGTKMKIAHAPVIYQPPAFSGQSTLSQYPEEDMPKIVAKIIKDNYLKRKK